MLVNADMTASLGRLGLTASRTTVLWHLLHRGPSTQKTIADAMSVSARTVTGLVDGLVATGFVTREAHPTDRRAILVTLTPHGTEVMGVMAEQHPQFAHLLFDDLSSETYAQFVAGLDHVLAQLRAHVDPTDREHR